VVPGAIAQLEERLDRTQEVGSSSLPSSITAVSRAVNGTIDLDRPRLQVRVVLSGSQSGTGYGATKTITLTFLVRPNAAGRRLITHPAYRVKLNVWASYLPIYTARQTNTEFHAVHPAR
jgi:hypothetical protein